MNNIENIADTTKAKSDQLNADDLIGNPITVEVLNVKRHTRDQPILINISGGNMPFLPCKSMRRVLVTAWGVNAKEWIGRSMTLYCDPTVTWGGVAVGGVRISHLSHIDMDIKMSISKSRKKVPIVIKKIDDQNFKIITDLIMELNINSGDFVKYFNVKNVGELTNKQQFEAIQLLRMKKEKKSNAP